MFPSPTLRVFSTPSVNFLHQNHRQLSISGWLHQAHVKGRHLQVKLKSASVQKYHLSGSSKDISKEYLEELGLTNDYVEILGCIETYLFWKFTWLWLKLCRTCWCMLNSTRTWDEYMHVYLHVYNTAKSKIATTKTNWFCCWTGGFSQTELISQTSLWHINSGKQPLTGKRHIFPHESYKVEAETLWVSWWYMAFAPMESVLDHDHQPKTCFSGS